MRFLILLSLVLVAYAHPGNENLISVEDALEDLDFLKAQIQEVHPFPTLYQSHYEAEQLFSELRATVKHPIEKLEFFNLVAQYTTSFKDGHTYPDMGFIQEQYTQSLDKTNTILPVDIDFVEDWFYIKETYNEALTPLKGSRLIAINGYSVEEIIKAFQVYYAKKAALLDNAHARLFKAYFWLSFGDFKRWSIAYQLENEVVQKLEVVGLSPDEFTQMQSKQPTADNMPAPSLYSFEYIMGGKVGLLTFTGMGDLDRFKVFIKDVFAELQRKKFTTLVIDMRKNGGGSSAIGDELYAYLSKEPYYEGRMFAKISAPIQNWYKEKRKGHPLYDLVVNTKTGEMISTPEDMRTTPPEVAFPFQGKTFLITGKKTYSSGHMFAGLFKCNDIGIVVGQATGQATKTVGDSFTFQLPNSKININVSYKIFEGPCESSYAHGFKPHYEVAYSSKDLKAGRDKEMELINLLISEGN